MANPNAQTVRPSAAIIEHNGKRYDMSDPAQATELAAEIKRLNEERDAALKLAGDEKVAKEKAERDAEDARKAAESPPRDNSFRLKVGRYSTKPYNGKVHPNAGQSKGVVEIYSRGSRYAISMAVDQWEDVKANVAQIDEFIAKNRAELKNMSEILG